MLRLDDVQNSRDVAVTLSAGVTVHVVSFEINKGEGGYRSIGVDDGLPLSSCSVASSLARLTLHYTVTLHDILHY